jgi:putative nucleotidyltransferase with HDIG domain
MKQLSTKSVKEGMVLAANIHSRGKTLFRRGHKLRRGDIDFLRRAGLRSLPISDEDGGVSRTGTINEATREEAVSVVREVLLDFENLTPKRYEKVREVASKIVDDVLATDDLKIQAHDLRTYDEYTYRHSVNVTAITVSIARLLNWDARDLRSLAAGALMHDIGKMRIPEDILRKEGRLDEEERLVIQRHPVWGFQLLSEKKCGSSPVVDRPSASRDPRRTWLSRRPYG